MTSRSPSVKASASAATTSRYNGSPIDPGSLVRSRTPTVRTVAGSASRSALVGNGRYSRTCTTPTRSPRSTRAATVCTTVSRARAHHHQHSLRLRVSVVVDDVHLPAGALAKAGHQVLDHIGNPCVERVYRFTRLKEDVRVLRGAANERALGRQRSSAMGPHQLLGHQRPQVVVRQRLDRVEFVRGSESVEEVHERYPGRQRGRLRHECQVLCLLHRGRREQRESRLPHGHHVGVVTEDRQCLRCHATGRPR